MLRGWAAHRVGGEALAGWAAEAPRWTVVGTPARVFNPSRTPRTLDGDGEWRDGGRGRLFPFTGSSFNRKRKPAPSALLACLPACLPACQPTCLPVCQPARLSPLSHSPLPPPVSLGIYGNLSVSTIFVVAWFRLARDSKLIDSFGCRTGWIHFLGIRSEHVTRRKTGWGGRVDKSWGGYFKPLNFNR